jgi:hypothetical protein
MNTTKLLKSLCGSLFVLSILLYLFQYVLTLFHFDLYTIFWLSFASAIVALFITGISVACNARASVHSIFLQGIPIAFGFLPLCFPSAEVQWIHQSILMTIIAAVYAIIALAALITHWQLVYENLDVL